MRGVAGAVPLRSVLEGYKHAAPESPLERRFLRLLRAAGLPEPEVQYPIRDGERLVARVDFAYPEIRLAMEVDGYRWHGGRRVLGTRSQQRQWHRRQVVAHPAHRKGAHGRLGGSSNRFGKRGAIPF